jgi:putative transferase (TIGR04331 family)
MTTILVTTKSHFPSFSQDLDFKLIVLGEDLICPYEYPDKNINTVKYHWHDDAKRSDDYAYLSRLYITLISKLTDVLNSTHGVHENQRYWEIIIGPWLVAFVSAFFDRWEMYRIAEEQYKTFELSEDTQLESVKPLLDYQEFIESAAYSDEFNHNIFVEVARFKNNPRIKVSEIKCHSYYLAKPSKSCGLSFYRLFRIILLSFRNFSRRTYGFLSGLNSTKSRVLIQVAYFPYDFLLKLISLLRFHVAIDHNFGELKSIDTRFGYLRNAMALKLRTHQVKEDNFYNFCLVMAPKFIPASALENLEKIKFLNSKTLRNITVIFTANDHFANESFKIWAAERVKLGTLLFISEHGGSIPAKNYLFRFEERISDVFTTTFAPSYSNHIQLPPSTFIGRMPVKKRDNCALLIVVFPGVRWAIRASSHPISLRALDAFNLLECFKRGLKMNATKALSVKLPENSLNWGELEARYINLVTEGKVFRGRLLDAIAVSRIIVCTYPQTTFTDAMLSGVPTIILFELNTSDVEENAEHLINEMLRVGICFHDSALASAHINRYWENPEDWWNSAEVLAVREAFKLATMNSNCMQLETWATFFNEQTQLQKIKKSF